MPMEGSWAVEKILLWRKEVFLKFVCLRFEKEKNGVRKKIEKFLKRKKNQNN